MNNRMRLPIVHSFIVMIIVMLLAGWLPQRTQAQSVDEAPLTIVSVETSQFPTVNVTVDGATWPAERATAPLQILVDGVEQSIAAEETSQQGIGFMIAIDPNNLEAAGENRYTQLTGALLDPIENGILLRGQDWMAAYHLMPDGLQSVQTWTQEPNEIFNQIVLNPPTTVRDTPLSTATLINALQQFADGPAAATPTRSLLLISAGTDALAAEEVTAVANELAVRIHVIALPGGDSNAATPLAQLAQATGGAFVVLESPGVLPPLWARLAADHQQRVLTFQSTVAAPQSLAVRLQLPTGDAVIATADASVFAALPVAAEAATNVAPAAQTVLTRSEVQAPVANSQPAAAAAESAANQPAPVAAPADVSATEQTPGAILIPGLQLAIPRTLLQWSLPILFVLIGYFVYAEMRDRRRQRNLSRQQAPFGYPAEAIDPRFALGDESRPLAPSRFDLHEQNGQGGSGFAMRSAPELDEPSYLDAPPRGEAPAKVPPPGRVAPAAKVTPPARPPARRSSLYQEEDENEATMRPARMEDDEATYRAQEVEQVVIGHLVRANSDPNLPKELPIYGLNPAPGEVRQIHIGRHSKHNTVVINEKSISREHAVIVQRAGRLYLRDNGSTSGTYLNGKRLNAGEELLLRHNDLVSFGQAVYEFRLHGEDEVTLADA